MQSNRPHHTQSAHFTWPEHELLVDGQALSALAERAGQTPFFAYSRAAIQQRARTLRTALAGKVALHYAVKANPFSPIVCLLANELNGFDVASAAEMQLALNAGMPAAQISFAGPGKRDQELRQAIAAGVTLNVESVTELRRIATHATQMGLAPHVALRINPDFELKSSGMKMSGGAKPFGIDAENVPSVVTEARTLGLMIEGFHIFAGSQNLQAASIIEAQQKSFELASQLAHTCSLALTSLNLGGGFGIPYFQHEATLDTAPIIDNLLALAAKAEATLPGCTLAIELGRYLVGEAGIYVTRVIDRKESRGKTFLITDGGMNHHLAASGNLGQVLRKNYPVFISQRSPQPSTATELTNIHGPLCTPLDVLAEKLALPSAQPGDLVVVFQSGAYGPSASPQGFLSHPTPLEILV